MTTSNNDSLILKLTVSKNLIDQELAKEVFRQSQAEGRPAVEILQERGILTQHIAQSLQKEAERIQGPKIIGGFRVVSKIGQGGMGSVYKAVQVSMEREVALKVIAPEFAKDKEACERFIREGRAAGRINHPNVITCYDVGQDGRILFMAMELVLGGDADKAAKAAGGRLPVPRALEIVRDAARGLVAIHAAGLIHRDIKPANIFLTQSGEAKLADLGLARSQQGDDRMTVSGATVGTPAFMSPEQADGAPDVDIRGDIYALGATLYALICGQAPFRGSSPWAVVASVLKDPFPDPRKLGCSDAVASIIERACAKDRTQRYQDPGQLLADLDRTLAGGPVATVPPPAPAAPPRIRPAMPRPTPPTSPLWRSQGFLATATGVLILIAAMAWWVVSPQGKHETHPGSNSPESPSAASASMSQSPAPAALAQQGVVKNEDQSTSDVLALYAGRWEPKSLALHQGNIIRDFCNWSILIHPDMKNAYVYIGKDRYGEDLGSINGVDGLTFQRISSEALWAEASSLTGQPFLIRYHLRGNELLVEKHEGRKGEEKAVATTILERVEPCTASTAGSKSFWDLAHGTWYISDDPRWLPSESPDKWPSFIAINRDKKTFFTAWNVRSDAPETLRFDPIRNYAVSTKKAFLEMKGERLLATLFNRTAIFTRLYAAPTYPKNDNPSKAITRENILRLAIEAGLGHASVPTPPTTPIIPITLDAQALAKRLAGTWIWCYNDRRTLQTNKKLIIAPDLQVMYFPPLEQGGHDPQKGRLDPQWDGRVWTVTTVWWKAEISERDDRLLVIVPKDLGYGWRKESDTTTEPIPPAAAAAPVSIPAAPAIATSMTAETSMLLARFAGRWETVTELVKDSNGWAIHRDPRNQALLIHPDQMDACRYTRVTLTPPWNGYKSPIVAITPERIDIRHMDHGIICSYALRNQATLVRTLTEDYSEEAGKVLLPKGTDIILKRQAAGAPRSEWEPQLWRSLDGLWETQLDGQKKGIFLIDAQRQLLVGSDGYAAPLFVDPLRALLVRDIYHTLHHDPVHDALIWMEGWTPVTSQRSSGQGWVPFPEKTIPARTGPLPASPPLDKMLARRLEGIWRNKNNTAEMRISTKDGTITFPAPGAFFVDKGVPEIIPRAIRSVGNKGDFDLLRTTMPFRIDGQRLLLNCSPDFTIGTARIEVSRWFHGKPESLEQVAP